MRTNGIIVAIDGPVGVGKSTVAKQLAEQLGYVYIDTGAMYRAVTWKAMQTGLDLQNRDAVAELVKTVQIRFVRQSGGLRILCDNKDVSEAIRLPEVSKNTSPIADHPEVRKRLVALQQEMGKSGGVVMEGRDIGTVVFPEAEVKIFLDADPKIRAQRRYQELLEKGIQTTLQKTLDELLERDRRDRSRPVGALKVTEDSVVVDTSSMTQPEVVHELLRIVQDRL